MPQLRKRNHSVAAPDSGRYLPWKAHRLRGLVTLEEIAGVTKISKRFLEAIEDGAYRELPGGLFTTSYIRQYAELIGYDSGEILLHQGGGALGQDATDRSEGRYWGNGMLGSAVEKG